MSHFRPCDRDTTYLLPPSLDEWLPKDHPARRDGGLGWDQAPRPVDTDTMLVVATG